MITLIFYADANVDLPFTSISQNFLFMTKDENSALKVIDFGLSDFVKPGWPYNFFFGSLLIIAFH